MYTRGPIANNPGGNNQEIEKLIEISGQPNLYELTETDLRELFPESTDT